MKNEHKIIGIPVPKIELECTRTNNQYQNSKEVLEDIYGIYGIGSLVRLKGFIENIHGNERTFFADLRDDGGVIQLYGKESVLGKETVDKILKTRDVVVIVGEVFSTATSTPSVRILTVSFGEPTELNTMISMSNVEVPKTETVNHPNHYIGTRQYEPVDIIRDWELNFNLGNAVKYISRAGRKGSAKEDLLKAVFYLNHEINNLENE